MSILSAEAIKKLQQEYMRSFPEKWALISTAFEKQQWDVMMTELHKFSGSGTTYKMPEISKVSKAIELYLEKHTSPDLQLLWDALEVFRQILEARQNFLEPLDVYNLEIMKRLAS